MSDDTSKIDADDFGQERLVYSAFYNKFVTRRPGQAPSKIDNWLDFVLPNQSVLHTLNGFETLEPTNDGLPNADLPVLKNEKYPIFLKIDTKVSDAESRPFGVKESFIYRPNTLMSLISHYHSTHKQFHRIMSDRTLGSMEGVLTWVDYSPLNEIRVNGTMSIYRKFDIIFRTILNKVVSIGSSRNHYILIPQSSGVYNKSVLARTYKELTNASIHPFDHDPSIFPIIHLLGFVFGKSSNLDVSPYKEDVLLYGKENSELDSYKSTSLLERIPEELTSKINFIIQRDDKAIVYNLKDISNFSEDPSFYIRFYRHIMSLRMGGQIAPDHIDVDSDQFDNFINAVSDKSTDISQPENNSVDDHKPETVIKTTDSKVETGYNSQNKNKISDGDLDSDHEDIDDRSSSNVLSGKSFEEKVRKTISSRLENDYQNDRKTLDKRHNLIESHFSVVLGGKTLGELAQSPTNVSVTSKTMDFLKTVPEESYKTTSIIDIDKSYQKNGYYHDMARVLGSLAKHGYYCTKIEETRVNTEMDRTINYKISVSDESGKSHQIKFTLPDIDEAGLMKISGTEYRLTRQIANVPICKVSPTRVNLSSYYNKIIVDRVQTKRSNYEQDIYKLIDRLKSEGLVEAIYGSADLPNRKVPYDYTAIGRSFTEISFDKFRFMFSANGAGKENLNFSDQDRLKDVETLYGTFVGFGPNDSLLCWNMKNEILEINRKNEKVNKWRSFNHLLVSILGENASPKKTVSEWTEARIINQVIPLVFILGYKLGLKTVFDRIKLSYNFYPTGSKPVIGTMDISVKFSDGVLVFNRYPLARSLIASGLNWVSLKDISFRDMNVPETYATILRKKQMTVGVLKGIDGFYDFFVDPITESILEKMGEPITFHELLLRASSMLSDYMAIESSSVQNHRFRLHERFNGFVYNEIFRALANYRNNASTRKAFSINPEAVFLKVVQDPTISPNDVINPVHEVKQRANFTFTGAGGRTTNSFVLRDRIYPKDGLGVISESVPDSGKVGITAYLSASPRIDDIHGMPIPYRDGDTLTPPQILSIGSMVMPGGTADDGKRNNYLSIQISHYVPNHNDGETLAVRTGYEEVLPHLSSSLFAVEADDDGIVESIDEKNKVIKVLYKEKNIPVIENIKIPYIDSLLSQYKDEKVVVGFLIPDSDISRFPVGGIFGLTKNTNGRVIDRIRVTSVDDIPDKNVARKQSNLVHDLTRGRYNSLYFIRFSLIGTKTKGERKAISYGDEYTMISGAYLLQKRKPNVKEGERFKRGDILVFNPGFFVESPLSKQVTFKHGVVGTVALIEKSSNHEDACEISQSLASRLMMTPAHQREIVTTKDAVILKMVKLGDHVETSDSLCVISDDYIVQVDGTIDPENLDIMEKLNRQTPSAGYTGTISKIKVLYSCDREKLSDSLKTILKTYEKEVRDSFKAIAISSTITPPDKPGWVKPGTKYKGIDFSDDTVVIEFMIQEELGVAEGDKICLGLSSKSIISHVSEKQHYTQSGIPVDVLFSTTSIVNRIVSSPFNGLTERNMEKLKENVLDIYFGENK